MAMVKLSQGLAAVESALSQNPEGFGEYAKSFAGAGGFALGPPAAQWGTLRIGPDDEMAGAMALAALTIGRASYQHVPLLTAKEASKKLKLKSPLPQGLYVLLPGKKIAAAIFPMIPEGAGFGAPNASAEAFEALCLDPKALRGKVEASAFSCDLRAEPDKLFEWPANFASALMSKSSAAQTLAAHGFGARTRMLSSAPPSAASWGAPKTGYPAFWDLGETSRPLDRSCVQESDTHVPLARCMGAPTYNHCGHSLINNCRELAEAETRAPERAQVFDSMLLYWAQSQKARQGLSDALILKAKGYDGDFGAEELGEREWRAEREALAASIQRQSFGSARELVISPWKSMICQHGNKQMVGSLDFALVDGQHSSYDYGLLLGSIESSLSGTPWLGEDLAKKLEDCSPRRLRSAFKDFCAQQAKSTGLDLPKDDASQEALWEDFALFAKGLRSPLKVSPVADPALQNQKTIQANARSAQSNENLAMLTERDAIAEFVELANEEARRVGDPAMLLTVKSLYSNPAFSGGAASLAMPFDKVFPAMYALCKGQERTKRLAPAFADLYPAPEADAKEAKALGYPTLAAYRAGHSEKLLRDDLAKKFHKMDPTGPDFDDLAERAKALLELVGKFKGRQFKLTKTSAAAMFGEGARPSVVAALSKQLPGNTSGASSANRGAFEEAFESLRSEMEASLAPKRLAEFMELIAKKSILIRNGSKASGATRSYRAKMAYAMFAKARGMAREIDRCAELGHVMSKDLAENIMLSVGRHVDGKDYGRGMWSHERVGLAMDRLHELAERGYAHRELNFNQGRESLAASVEKSRAEAKQARQDGEGAFEGFSLRSVQTEHLALLLDAMPVGRAAASLAPQLAAMGIEPSGQPKAADAPVSRPADTARAKRRQGALSN